MSRILTFAVVSLVAVASSVSAEIAACLLGVGTVSSVTGTVTLVIAGS